MLKNYFLEPFLSARVTIEVSRTYIYTLADATILELLDRRQVYC